MKNMIFAFKSDTPKYKQIYEQFKTLIEQGNIQADERLPSIRELADIPAGKPQYNADGL